MNPKSKKSPFVCFAQKAALWAGSAYTSIVAALIIVIWGFTGPIFNYSDTWQLVINTGTSVITFLMVFLIQNTQNRDSRTIQLKLDELIRATAGAHTVLLDLEELSDAELETISAKYTKIAEVARKRLHSGKTDTDIPKILLDKNLLK